MNGIFIYDWRSKCVGIGVAFEEGEKNVVCYNRLDLGSPLDWDVSLAIKRYYLGSDEEWKIRCELARSIPYLLMMKRDCNI